MQPVKPFLRMYNMEDPMILFKENAKQSKISKQGL